MCGGTEKKLWQYNGSLIVNSTAFIVKKVVSKNVPLFSQLKIWPCAAQFKKSFTKFNTVPGSSADYFDDRQIPEVPYLSH